MGTNTGNGLVKSQHNENVQKLNSSQVWVKNVVRVPSQTSLWLLLKYTSAFLAWFDFVFCSCNLDVLRAQRITDLNYPQINEVMKSDHVFLPVGRVLGSRTRRLCQVTALRIVWAGERSRKWRQYGTSKQIFILKTAFHFSSGSQDSGFGILKDFG